MKLPNQLTGPRAIQLTVFIIFCVEYIALLRGWIHVPTAAEDVKLFWMLFSILNTILSVQALATAIQRDNSIETKISTKENTDETVSTSTTDL